MVNPASRAGAASDEAAPLYLGIDFGTSGVRACVTDAEGTLVATARCASPPPDEPCPGYREQDAETWWRNLERLMGELPGPVRGAITRVSVDGTSGTLLLTDAAGTPRGPTLMYDDARAVAQANTIRAHAPATSGAHGASASLAKLLWLRDHGADGAVRHALHQADWIIGRLTGRWGVSDSNNALKLGFDPVNLRWPDWLDGLGVPRHWLPAVGHPGEPVGAILPRVAERLGLPVRPQVVLGTTDSIAAFLATGAHAIGDAVTSLGSTLAIKILADRPVFAPEFGVYSHRLGDLWLVGGASNTGGAVLRQFFTNAELAALSPAIDPDRDSGLDYYPLARPGERFPVADPTLPPRISPIPVERAQFLHGLLEGIARIERLAYDRLAALGAPRPVRVLTLGGGACNPQWSRLRQRLLGCPVQACPDVEAACGAARLARRASATGFTI